uniref:Uncharacterized protein n=1 Tax=Picea glauca TaxID=3330 RepID=A0A101M1W6_PICGL|nr:hypothetical protein ABT39_MTgene3914 [Picea glauca]QHR91023.1 hypothetical protein Q903MT_gene5055 [Picea sitchensis]
MSAGSLTRLGLAHAHLLLRFRDHRQLQMLGA